MPRGGKRPGAGRPMGAVSKLKREIMKRSAEQDITPLEFMLQVMRDETEDTKRRCAMAAAAAPLMHRKPAMVRFE